MHNYFLVAKKYYEEVENVPIASRRRSMIVMEQVIQLQKMEFIMV